jgi:adenine-specific DNA-methyltransferase
MSGKGGFGHFSSSTRYGSYGKLEDTPEEIKERLCKNVARINACLLSAAVR